MTRASWGSSSGDMSGLFTGLLDEDRRRIEQSVQQDIQRSKEQQSAEDNDMYDKWQQGVISDQDWLHYVHQRMVQTKGDPTEHEQWTKTWREQRDAIRDAEMEQRYAEGSISIHKLIGYYGDQMSSQERNSPAYRDTSKRYYDLVDTRDSYYIEDEANRILNRIQRGQAGYGELRDFYQSMLGKVRRSSPLYRQIVGNLQSIKQIGTSAGGGGGGGGGGSRSGGSGGSGDRNPFSTASRAVLKLWKSGNVFVPSGPDVVASVTSLPNTDISSPTSIDNALASDSVEIENMLDYAQKHPDARYLTTSFGQKIPNTPQYRQAMMNQGLRIYDFRIAALHARGNSTIGVQNARAAFVENTFQAQNDATADDYWKQTRQEAWDAFEMASQNPDPQQAFQQYEWAGNLLLKRGHKLLGEKRYAASSTAAPSDSRYAGKELPQDTNPAHYGASKLFPEQSFTPEMEAEIRYTMRIGQLAIDARSMTPEELAHESSILFDDRPPSYFMTESDLQNVIGTNETQASPSGMGIPTAGIGMVGKSFAQRGLMAASEIRNSGNNISQGLAEPYYYVAGPGQTNPIAVPQSEINNRLGVDDYLDGTQVAGSWEKIGNQVQYVFHKLEPVKAPEWYYNGTRWLSPTDYEKIGRDAGELTKKGYSLQPIPELSGWSSYRDSDGTVWYRDPQDGHLYQGAPPFAAGKNGTAIGPIFDYADFVDSSGHLTLDNHRLPASTGAGFIVGFGADVSPQEAQTYTDQLVNSPGSDAYINLDYFHKRDDQNHVGVEGLTPDDITGMYWSPSDNVVNPGTLYAKGLEDRTMDYYDQRRIQIQDRAEIRRKAEVQSWIDQRFQNQKNVNVFNATNPDINLSDVASQAIEQAKEMTGIKLGDRLRQAKEQQLANLPDFQPAVLPTNRPPTPIAPPAPVKRSKSGGYVPNFATSGKAKNIPGLF